MFAYKDLKELNEGPSGIEKNCGLKKEELMFEDGMQHEIPVIAKVSLHQDFG